MPIPSTIVPARRRRGRGRTAQGRVIPSLVLVGATWNENDAIVTLTFDRAVDVSAFDPAQVTVNDGAINFSSYRGTDVSQMSPVQIQVTMANAGPPTGDQTLLSATALTLLAAVNNGGTWLGVSGLALPFP